MICIAEFVNQSGCKFSSFVAVLLKGGVNNVKSSSLTLRFSKLNAKYIKCIRGSRAIFVQGN